MVSEDAPVSFILLKVWCPFDFFLSSEFQKSLQNTGQGPHIKGTFMQFASFNYFFVGVF